jgi:hypothetical protein
MVTARGMACPPMSSDVISRRVTANGLLGRMSFMTGLDQLATFLRDRGLRANTNADADLSVANPVSSKLTEVVNCASGRYLTRWGYEVGQVGDEWSAAHRIAYLLGAPND